MKRCPTRLLACRLVLAVSSLCLALKTATATDLCGLITVNGQPAPGVIVAAYDCTTSIFVGSATSGPEDTNGPTPQNFCMTVDSADFRLELYYQDDPSEVLLTDYCRSFVFCGDIVPVGGVATLNHDMTCGTPPPPPPPVVNSSDYWISHPEAWPVDSVTVGGLTYSRANAIIIMKRPQHGDKSLLVFRELVAAELNVLQGSASDCITSDIPKADAWAALHRPGSRIAGRSSAWKQIAAVAEQLEQYNNGQLCGGPVVPTVLSE